MTKHRTEFFFFYLDDSMFRHIFKKQIIDLVLHNNDEYTGKASLKTYISNVYEHIY
jgi:hypothetical protein